MTCSIPKSRDVVNRLRMGLGGTGWETELRCFLASADFEETIDRLLELKKDDIYFCPRVLDIFNFLKVCPTQRVRAVMIIDKYHNRPGYTGIPLDNLTDSVKEIIATAEGGIDVLKWTKQGLLIMPLCPTMTVHGDPHYIIWHKWLAYMTHKFNENYSDIPYVLVGKRTIDRVGTLLSPHISKFTLWPKFEPNNWHKDINKVLEDKGQMRIIW